ncbi:ComF family protein [Streptomyces sp. MAR4 CNX-425]|uniref:ComF family protein n=1 Tax=Streptomyces sp. MAR4 CNX-425 TaxID=3406343 RepID=UPI003B507258
MRGTGRELAGLLLSAGCAGCGAGRGAGALCAECAAELTAGAVRRVVPRPRPPGLPAVYAAVAYGGAARTALLAHKERGALRLARPLGAALAAAVRAAATAAGSRAAGGRATGTSATGTSATGTSATGTRGAPIHGAGPRATGAPVAGAGPGARGRAAGGGARPRAPGGERVVLVPVPSARGAVVRRGHDPVRRAGLVAAERLRRGGMRAELLPVLRQRRAVADQAGLSAAARQRNLSGALEAVRGGVPPLRAPGCRVVLVDDVLTTGASLAEAARAVRAAGCRGVLAAAVVAAPRDAFEAGRACPLP